MSSSRFLLRRLRPSQMTSPTSVRYLSATVPHTAEHKDRFPDNVEEYRKTQTEKADNPHMTNTNSTISNEMPNLGSDKPPPEMISDVDPSFVPKDSVPENTERMTGDTQKGEPEGGKNKELGVGEMEGAKFRVEPLRRTGEDGATMRARLLCSCLTSTSFPFHPLQQPI